MFYGCNNSEEKLLTLNHLYLLHIQEIRSLLSLKTSCSMDGSGAIGTHYCKWDMVRGRKSGPGCKDLEALQVICCQQGRSVVNIDTELSLKEASKHKSSTFTVKARHILHLPLAVAQILPVRQTWTLKTSNRL